MVLPPPWKHHFQPPEAPFSTPSTGSTTFNPWKHHFQPLEAPFATPGSTIFNPRKNHFQPLGLIFENSFEFFSKFYKRSFKLIYAINIKLNHFKIGNKNPLFVTKITGSCQNFLIFQSFFNLDQYEKIFILTPSCILPTLSL